MEHCGIRHPGHRHCKTSVLARRDGFAQRNGVFTNTIPFNHRAARVSASGTGLRGSPTHNIASPRDAFVAIVYCHR
jgi:hypothetical protein